VDASKNRRKRSDYFSKLVLLEKEWRVIKKDNIVLGKHWSKFKAVDSDFQHKANIETITRI